MKRKCPFRCLPLSEWPIADHKAWERAVRPCDILDEPGPLAHMSIHTHTALRAAYGYWLGFLDDELPGGVGPTGLDHVSRENLSQFIERLQASLAPQSAATYVTSLATALHAMHPDHIFDFVWEAAKRLQRSATPVRDKRRRLKPAQDLYETGLDLMRLAENMLDRQKAAVSFRDGLMIALLASRPVRLSNLASIEIDRHVVRRGTEYWLEFPAEEVKTRQRLEFPLPRDLIEPLERYLVQYRPVLTATRGRWYRGPHSGLWVSLHGSKLKAAQIWHIIRQRTLERFGHPINPHLFRDAAATSIAVEDPAHVRTIASILGHTTLRTAERYYNQASSLEAARRYQAEVRTRRGASLRRSHR